MMFAALRHGARSGLLRTAPSSIRSKSTLALPPGVISKWYNIFGKSNAAYVTWIIGCVFAAEAITGSGTNMIWSSVNGGRTYDSVDWTKFIVEDDDDDEDEDDDEEEEGDDEEEEDE